MRGARGDAARRAEAAQATTSQSAFGDYVKFDDMFGASCIFTAGDPAQVQRQREAYVKETMARKLYGYVHRLETHGAPIQRVVVGGGCEAAENRGGFPTSRPRDEIAGAHGADALGGDDPLASRKRARAGASAGGRAVGVSPAPRGGVAPQWGARAFEGPGARLGNEGSLANLFEQSLGEDWEHDPFWASMDSLATPGTVGGVGGPLEDPNALLPGALSRGAATEEDLMRRARIELIEERLHSLEHALASERVPKRSDTAAGAGGSGGSDKSNAFVRSGGGSGSDKSGRFADGPRDFVPASGLGVPGHPRESDEVLERSPATNLFQSGLFVETRPREKKRGSSDKSASDKSGGGSGGSGKSPQSPSPLHRAPPDPSRSRSQSDERGTQNARRWTDTEKRSPRALAVSDGCAPSAEFPEVVPDEGARALGFEGGFVSGFGGDGVARATLLEHARDPTRDRDPHSDAAVHKVSTSFTSTPGGGARGGCGGESPRSAARRLAKENAALAEERRRAKQERDVLLAEHEHNKAQAALLQESNARYERRVAQLEALVRENAALFGKDAKRRGERDERETRERGFFSTRRDESAEKEEADAPSDDAEKTSSGVEGVMSGD